MVCHVDTHGWTNSDKDRKCEASHLPNCTHGPRTNSVHCPIILKKKPDRHLNQTLAQTKFQLFHSSSSTPVTNGNHHCHRPNFIHHHRSPSSQGPNYPLFHSSSRASSSGTEGRPGAVLGREEGAGEKRARHGRVAAGGGVRSDDVEPGHGAGGRETEH